MAKLPLTLAVLVAALATAVSAQTYSEANPPVYADLEWGQSASSARRSIERKGWKFDEAEDDGLSIFWGTVMGERGLLFLYASPELGLQKVIVWVMTDEKWPLAKASYYTLVSAMSDRYGEPDSSYDFLASPYDDMAGYECAAFASENGHYISTWFNNKVGTDIDRDCDVRVSYEGPRYDEFLLQQRDERTADF